MQKQIVIFLCTLLFFAASAAASESELRLGKFSIGDMNGWKEQTLGFFKAKTTYRLTRDGERLALQAISKKSASGLVHKLSADAKERPLLKWSWKIDHPVKKGDERTKEGDDYAARVYVIFPRGLFSQMRAISYVWANKLAKGEHIASPYTSNVITVAVDSGEELAGRWTYHQRNIYEDYRTFFREEPPKIGGVAIMTDSDNTGDSVSALYGDIVLAPLAKTTDPRHDQHTPKEPKGEEPHKDPPAPPVRQLPLQQPAVGP